MHVVRQRAEDYQIREDINSNCMYDTNANCIYDAQQALKEVGVKFNKLKNMGTLTLRSS